MQHRGTVSSGMFLILEVKGKGKGKTHDTIDYVAVSIGEMFAGKENIIFSQYSAFLCTP